MVHSKDVRKAVMLAGSLGGSTAVLMVDMRADKWVDKSAVEMVLWMAGQWVGLMVVLTAVWWELVLVDWRVE